MRSRDFVDLNLLKDVHSEFRAVREAHSVPFFDSGPRTSDFAPPHLVSHQRCLPQIFPRAELLQNEMCHVGARYPVRLNAVELRQDAIVSGKPSVCEETRANDDPVDVTGPDDLFLPVFVFVDSLQQEWPKQFVIEEAAVIEAVSRPDVRDRHQSGDSFRMPSEKTVIGPRPSLTPTVLHPTS